MQPLHCFKKQFWLFFANRTCIKRALQSVYQSNFWNENNFYVLLSFHSCCELNHKIKKTTVWFSLNLKKIMPSYEILRLYKCKATFLCSGCGILRLRHVWAAVGKWNILENGECRFYLWNSKDHFLVFSLGLCI